MKKLVSLLLVLVILLGLGGCRTGQEGEVYTVIEKVMTAIETNDFNLINKYAGNDAICKKLFVVDTNNLTEFAKLKMHRAMRDNMEYSVGEIIVYSDQSATAVVKVTMPKTEEIYEKNKELLTQKKHKEYYRAMEADILATNETKTTVYTVNFNYKSYYWMIDYAFIELVYTSMQPEVI